MLGAALLLTLAACGGGSGAAGPGPNPNPSPAGSARPAKNGDTFHYAGTLVETFWRPAQPGPSNAPSPVPTTTTSWTVDNLATVATNATFHGTTGLTDFAQTEVDTGLQTISTLTDDYFQFPSGGAGPLIENGFRSLDSNFVSTDLQRSAGSGVVDMLPETSGSTWTNSAKLTSVETDPDGQSSTRTVNADGSYAQADTFPDGTSAAAAANADGSGTYKVLLGTQLETDYAYGAPAGGNVTITVTEPAATPRPSPIVFTVPDWQPAGGLASDDFVDMGLVAVPAACALPVKFGTQGVEIADHRTAVDPIFGTLEDMTEDTFVVQGRGVACVTRLDLVTAFYDFSGQNGLAFFAGKPIQFTVINEGMSLRAESVLASGEHRTAEVFARGAVRLTNALRMHAARAIQAAARRARGPQSRHLRSRPAGRRSNAS
jgi:hypothetical protein